MSPHELRDKIAEAACELGFHAFGVAAVGDNDDPVRLYEWLTAGYQASMGWMARNAERRADIRHVMPGARSVISLAINYKTPESPDDCCGSWKVARYAWGEDYHRVLGRKLRELERRLREWAPDHEWRSHTDTGPVMEKAWAERAGLGWIGKNTCLITRSLGSWVFLAEVITTAELPADQPHTDFCGSCTRCLDACPTDAFPEPYVLDANKCISYWTIEHRGPIPHEIAHNADGWIFGCDICQDVCPWNKFGVPTDEEAFAAREDCVNPPVERWKELTDEEFREEFADSAIRRAKPEGLRRNIEVQEDENLRRIIGSAGWEGEHPVPEISLDAHSGVPHDLVK